MLVRRLGYRALSVSLVVTMLLALDIGAEALARGGRGAGTGDFFFGLLHLPLGGAALSTDPAGRLIVSNIGSSGQDGVSVSLSQVAPPGGVSPGWAGVLDFGPAGGLATGATVVVQARDQFGNAVCSLHIFETDGGDPGAHGQAGVGMTSDMFPASSITVRTLLHGVVVQSAQFLPPFPPMLAKGAIGNNGGNGVEVRASREKLINNQFDVEVCEDSVRLPSPTPITLSNGLPPVDGDELSIRLNGLPPGTRYIGNLAVIAGNTGPITVQDEGLLKTASKGTVKFFNETKGFGRMLGGGDVNGDGLPDIIVNNIGSSGQDGVSIKRFGIGDTAPAPPLGSVSAECDWGHAGALPAGSSMKFVVGNDAPVVRTYALQVTETGGGLASVSAIPCNEPGCCEPCCPCAGVVVEASRNGVVVDRVVHAALPRVIASGNIGSSGQDGVVFFAALIDSCLNRLDDRYLIGLRSPAPGSITLTGSSVGAVSADTVQVRITPVDDFGSLGNPQLLASGLSQFTILDEESEPAFHNDMTYDGLPHQALGSATLSVGSDGRLRASNIGSSGQDGVAIDLGAARGVSLDVDFGPAGALPPGSSISFGEPAMDSNDVNRMTIKESGGGHATLSYVQAQCPTCPLQVELLQGGHVVGSATYPPPYPSQLVSGDIGSSGSSRVKVVTDRDSGRSSIHNPVVTSMTLSGPGQTPKDADCVRYTLFLPNGTPCRATISVQITGVALREIDVSDDALLVHSTGDSAKGEAALCASRDNHLQGAVDVVQTLRVSNIGSSGNDGVSIELRDEDCDGKADDAESLSVTLTPATLPGGAEHAINTKGTGTAGLATSSSFFDVFMEVHNSGASNDVMIDLSSLGSSSYRTELYLAGTLVLSQPGQSGPLVAQAPDTAALRTGHSAIRLDAGKVTVQLGCVFNSPGPIVLPIGVAAVGDEIRVIAENPTFHPSGISSMSLTGAGLTGGEFTITGESGKPLNTCPADVAPVGAPDHAVNVNDLLLVITTWGACTTCPLTHCAADIAPIVGVLSVGDCRIDVNDLLAVITHWGACP